jgi:hypothetical protein
MTLFDKIKQRVWRSVYRFFPTLQRVFLKWGIIWHEEGRQRYHIGWLSPGRTLKELKVYLHTKWGFGNHFIAWPDESQVLSWRKLEGFEGQYHLRVFSDGEIRGHFELTPEAHPIEHFEEKGEEDRRGEFLRFLGDYAVEKKHISRLSIDPDAFNPDSETTLDTKK